MSMATTYRHRETGTLARLAGVEATPSVTLVTLECAENPRHHYEAAFPFAVRREAIYADTGGPYLNLMPGPIYTEPLTITDGQLAAEWDAAD